MTLNLDDLMLRLRPHVCLQTAAVGLLVASGGCVAEKSLGDPADTDGGSGTASVGATEGADPTTDPTIDPATNPSQGSQSSTQSGTNPGGETETTFEPETATDTDASDLELCVDFTPPPIECEPAGKGVTEYAGSDFYDDIDTTCTVTAVEQDDFGTETIVLACGDETYAVGYTSRSPHLAPAVAADDEVLFSYRDEPTSPNLEPSFTLSSLEGDLLVAFIMELETANDLLVDLGDIEISYLGTGCAGFEVPAAACNEQEQSIVAARIDVDIALGDDSLVLSEGGSGVVGAEGESFAVSVGQAQRIVCWDDGCAGDKTGPFDLVEVLIVAQP